MKNEQFSISVQDLTEEITLLMREEMVATYYLSEKKTL